MAVEIFVRSADGNDINFIKNSWEKSFEKTMKAVPREIYHRGQQKLMNQLMAKASCYVACSPEDNNQIFGWMLFEKIKDIGILHYIYVKHPYRRYGIGKSLYNCLDRNDQYPCIASHKTLYLEYIQDKWNLTYNPYILIG